MVLCQDPDKNCRWICRCDCGREVSVISNSLRSGKSSQCRDCFLNSKRKDLSEQRFGKWTVLKRGEKKGDWVCVCDCGKEKIVQLSQLKYGKGEGCVDCWNDKNAITDLSGNQFSKWTVVKHDMDKPELDFWICICKCGRKKSVYGSHLRLGKSVSCRKCSELKHKGKLNSAIWCRILWGAKKRNLEVDITKEFMYDLFYNKQKEKCALTGLDISLADTVKGHKCGESTASLDRIDSSIGYVEGNVQWVHKYVNRMKWNLDEETFFKFCKLITEYRG